MAIPYRYIRKCIALGNSLLISLPAIWRKAVNLKKQDKVYVEVYADRIVIRKEI